MDFEAYIDDLIAAIESWAHPDNPDLKKAAHKTVQDGYFSSSDVNFAVHHIRESVTDISIRKWFKSVGSQHKWPLNTKVLCLHAGNIPMVGIQDMLAVLLSGCTYFGKISRSDPYLIPSLLDTIKQKCRGVSVHYSVNIDDFKNCEADYLLFAGSESSVPDVMDLVDKQNMIIDEPSYLIRTAHFSMAYLDKLSDKVLMDLAEAMFRYNGKGCRSVGVVISPNGLEEVQESLVDIFKHYLDVNSYETTNAARVKYQYAYNQAVGIPQIAVGPFIIQEGEPIFTISDTIKWIKGDVHEVRYLAHTNVKELQQIYVTDESVIIEGFRSKVDVLWNAQTPSIDWKPDGIDPLAWLMSKSKRG